MKSNTVNGRPSLDPLILITGREKSPAKMVAAQMPPFVATAPPPSCFNVHKLMAQFRGAPQGKVSQSTYINIMGTGRW